MLIIARNKLKFLQAGRELVIAHRNPTRYQHGRSYALGLDHRRQLCRVEILEIQAASLRVRLARHYEPIRLLAARSNTDTWIIQRRPSATSPKPSAPKISTTSPPKPTPATRSSAPTSSPRSRPGRSGFASKKPPAAATSSNAKPSARSSLLDRRDG